MAIIKREKNKIPESVLKSVYLKVLKKGAI